MRIRRQIIVFAVFVVLCFCVSQNALAATLTVSSAIDTNGGTCSVNCSLREAVSTANDGDTGQAFEQCVYNYMRLHLGMKPL